jgi:hypothetical protein
MIIIDTTETVRFLNKDWSDDDIEQPSTPEPIHDRPCLYRDFSIPSSARRVWGLLDCLPERYSSLKIRIPSGRGAEIPETDVQLMKESFWISSDELEHSVHMSKLPFHQMMMEEAARRHRQRDTWSLQEQVASSRWTCLDLLIECMTWTFCVRSASTESKDPVESFRTLSDRQVRRSTTTTLSTLMFSPEGMRICVLPPIRCKDSRIIRGLTAWTPYALAF